MSSRYCKSIPSEIYFTKDLNGWYGGPYVHPPKGKVQVITCKIVNITVGNPLKKVKSDTLGSLINTAEKERFAEEHKGSYPADMPSEKELRDSKDLSKLADWLKSEEGKMLIREAQEKTEEDCKIIDKLRDIDPQKLREPFDI